MNKIIIFFICTFFFISCSFNKNSKFWTASQKITQENLPKHKKMFTEEKVLEKEFNVNISLNAA